MKKPTIGIIGSGNMAFCLGKGLFDAGFKITEVYSRNKVEGKKLSKNLLAKYIHEVIKLEGTADIYFFCLQDDAIHEITEQLPFTNKLCVHTSGSVPLSILINKFKNCGVLYPVQSFNKDKITDWASIPICIEGSSKKNEDILLNLAKKLSNNVIKLKSNQRRDLHLAAVFANNFTNACYQMAAEILEQKNISFNLLGPLILNTAEKILTSDPKTVQTGPAIRQDKKVLKLQETLLKDKKDLVKIYKLLSNYIKKETN